jgi:tellurite resistance protein TerC
VRVSALAWAASIAGILAVLAVDLLVVSRRARRPTTGQALLAVGVYVGLALGFGWWVGAHWGGGYSGQFYAGWLTEYSLSLDNLFVFVIIMSRFRVPAAAQHTVLLVGIVLALVFRGIFIAAGAIAIARWSWVYYIFGAFLVWAAIGLARHGEDPQAQFKENLLLRGVGRMVATTAAYDGLRLGTRVDGRRVLTPMLIVMVAIGSTDVLFALDSIPAVFGLTRSPYLVFAANAFALTGLMQLYFLLGGLLDRLVFLGRGLAVVLGFIGVKMVLEALHANRLGFLNGGAPVTWAPLISTSVSLGVIGAVIAVTTFASLARSRATST